MIETPGNRLINNLHVKKAWARDLWYLTNRICRKILADTFRYTFPNGNAHFFNAPNLSAALKKALNYTLGPERFCQFRVSDLKEDFRYEEGIIKRESNTVIKITASHQLVFDPPHGAKQDQHSYIPCLSGLVKSAPVTFV